MSQISVRNESSKKVVLGTCGGIAPPTFAGQVNARTGWFVLQKTESSGEVNVAVAGEPLFHQQWVTISWGDWAGGNAEARSAAGPAPMVPFTMLDVEQWVDSRTGELQVKIKDAPKRSVVIQNESSQALYMSDSTAGVADWPKIERSIGKAAIGNLTAVAKGFTNVAVGPKGKGEQWVLIWWDNDHGGNAEAKSTGAPPTLSATTRYDQTTHTLTVTIRDATAATEERAQAAGGEDGTGEGATAPSVNLDVHVAAGYEAVCINLHNNTHPFVDTLWFMVQMTKELREKLEAVKSRNEELCAYFTRAKGLARMTNWHAELNKRTAKETRTRRSLSFLSTTGWDEFDDAAYKKYRELADLAAKVMEKVGTSKPFLGVSGDTVDVDVLVADAALRERVGSRILQLSTLLFDPRIKASYAAWQKAVLDDLDSPSMATSAVPSSETPAPSRGRVAQAATEIAWAQWIIADGVAALQEARLLDRGGTLHKGDPRRANGSWFCTWLGADPYKTLDDYIEKVAMAPIDDDSGKMAKPSTGTLLDEAGQSAWELARGALATSAGVVLPILGGDGLYLRLALLHLQRQMPHFLEAKDGFIAFKAKMLPRLVKAGFNRKVTEEEVENIFEMTRKAADRRVEDFKEYSKWMTDSPSDKESLESFHKEGEAAVEKEIEKAEDKIREFSKEHIEQHGVQGSARINYAISGLAMLQLVDAALALREKTEQGWSWNNEQKKTLADIGTATAQLTAGLLDATGRGGALKETPPAAMIRLLSGEKAMVQYGQSVEQAEKAANATAKASALAKAADVENFAVAKSVTTAGVNSFGKAWVPVFTIVSGAYQVAMGLEKEGKKTDVALGGVNVFSGGMMLIYGLDYLGAIELSVAATAWVPVVGQAAGALAFAGGLGVMAYDAWERKTTLPMTAYVKGSLKKLREETVFGLGKLVDALDLTEELEAFAAKAESENSWWKLPKPDDSALEDSAWRATIASTCGNDALAEALFDITAEEHANTPEGREAAANPPPVIGSDRE